MTRHDIRFGTDGWRAVIADGFTFETVRLVARAIGVAARGFEPPPEIDRNSLVVGYDRRFLSREFAETAAEELAASGFKVLLSASPLPSQTVSHAAWHRRVLGGVVITASHNPAAYNGVKFKGWYGGSGLPEMYAAIAERVGESAVVDGGSVEETDFLADYCQALRGAIDLEVLRNAGLRILHDPIHGVASGIPARVLGADSTSIVTTVRGESNPSFGGANPEPIPGNIDPAMEAMADAEYDLAICNDGDADRVGILDERGEFVSPHKLIGLLALELVRRRGAAGEIVKTFSTSRIVETIAHRLEVPFHETPIGFKYVADLMLSRNVVIGGEESGGIGFGSFLPERDGILSGLLAAECVASSGKSLSALVADMEEEFGRLHYGRRDVRSPMPANERLIARALSGELDSRLGGRVVSREDKDGVKLNFENGAWILFRKSGTEPIIRIYCESPDENEVESMLHASIGELC
jgi:phosphomannomutase